MGESGAGAWSVYLLLCADGTLYCGVTTDVRRRLEAHNGLRAGGAKYTRSRRPVRLLACAEGFCRAEALRLERAVKKAPRAHKCEVLRRRSGGNALPSGKDDAPCPRT